MAVLQKNNEEIIRGIITNLLANSKNSDKGGANTQSLEFSVETLESAKNSYPNRIDERDGFIDGNFLETLCRFLENIGERKSLIADNIQRFTKKLVAKKVAYCPSANEALVCTPQSMLVQSIGLLACIDELESELN
jgi:hypothetical protein